MKLAAALACACGTVLRLYAQGYFVPDGVTYAGMSLDGVGYGVNVMHDPDNSLYTGFIFDPRGSTPPGGPFVNTYRFSSIVDVGVRVFLVSPNDPISLQPILANNYQELTFPDNYIFQVGTPFYVGLYTGNDQFAPPGGIYADPIFGWAELENVNGAIEMLDSALEYQGGGIIAGTQTIIPEPGTLALLGVGMAIFGFFRARREN